MALTAGRSLHSFRQARTTTPRRGRAVEVMKDLREFPARFVRATGRAYTPKKTVRFEDRLALAAQNVMGERPFTKTYSVFDGKL